MTVTSKLPLSFHVMAKPTGATCNLNCDYCFFLKKEKLYPDTPSVMSDEVMQQYIRQTIEAQHHSPHITIAWQGGEPTLRGLGFFRRAMAYQQQFARPGRTIENTIQTNGTLLDDVWCEFLREHNFLVGISLDGPAQYHDVYRRDNESGYQEGTLVTERTVDAEDFGRFLNTIFDEWVKRDIGQVYVPYFDAVLASYVYGASSVCTLRPTCGDALALEHNGDLYSCDHYVEPDYLLGNIMETPLAELVSSVRQRTFGTAKRDTLPRYCRECKFLFTCHGECPKNRIISTPDGKPGLNWLCAGLKLFFEHTEKPMREMAKLLKSGRFADEIMGRSEQ